MNEMNGFTEGFAVGQGMNNNCCNGYGGFGSLWRRLDCHLPAGGSVRRRLRLRRFRRLRRRLRSGWRRVRRGTARL